MIQTAYFQYPRAALRFLLPALLSLTFFFSYSQLRLPRLVSDGMVLQRDVPVKLWGWAAPGEKLTLSFQNHQYKTTADGQGQWRLKLPPQKAGGPYQLTFTASNQLTLKDVLFGDVWVCSGQSNMELTMERVRYKYADLIAHINNPYIRQFEVPDRFHFLYPHEDLAGGQWLAATPGNLLRFSAVGYFFADELYQAYHVPIGLINAAVGGSPAEAWISEEALKAFPAHYSEAQKFKDSSLIARIEAHDRQAQGEWYQRLNSSDEGIKNHWNAPALNDADWEQMNLPGYWGDGPLGAVNGAVWFRKEVQVPRELAGQSAELLLGRIVDADSVWVNGRFVGTTSYQYPPRRYPVPAGVLKEGNNQVTVRVVSNGGKGGFVPDKEYALLSGNKTLDLTGSWKYRLGATMEPTPAQTFVRWKPLGLYNAMIAPLHPYAIKGVAWYQGESNAGAPGEYARLMHTLIEDWRHHWQQGAFPFLMVQLPNFMEARPQPAESGWAELRQAQLQTLSVPNTGLAVTIDLGEWNDIHPLNKKEVGHRLALQARRLAYGEKKVVASGPMLQSVERQGSKLLLTFTHTAGGLVARGGGALKQFAVAGRDGRFVWARAQITGTRVMVWSEAVAEPVAVRYAWADNPEGANLYNRSGLPASPFQVSVSPAPGLAGPAAPTSAPAPK